MSRFRDNFYKSLLCLLKIIQSKVPQDPNITDAIRAVGDCKILHPLYIIKEFYKIVREFEREILDRDESFFENLDISSRAEGETLKNILKFKDFWLEGKFDTDEKRDIWNLLIIIIHCCRELLNK